MIDKKAIGAVVATSLLLVVAVAAIVGFQGWYQTFSSETFNDVEQRSAESASNSGIEIVIGNNLYFKNGFGENITIKSVNIGGNDCDINGSFSNGIKSIFLRNCTQNLTTSTQDVIVRTDKGIFIKRIFMKNIMNADLANSFSLDCSSLNGGEWVAVPGNENLNTSDFCVMKYEAKNDGTTNCGGTSCPNSSSNGNPWVSITQTDAKVKCNALNNGTGDYHLITNAEWTTIARNIELVGANWDSGNTGVGTMAIGWVDFGNTNFAPFTNLSCIYNNGSDICSSVGNHKFRRTLFLSSGEEIWDLSGNVYEWNNDTCSQGDPWFYSISPVWVEWTNLNVNTFEKNLAGPNGDFSSTNGMGQYRGCSFNGNAFIRGGHWNYGEYGGIFNLALNLAPSNAYNGGGFRCVYTP